MRYLTWKLELASNILWLNVARNIIHGWPLEQMDLTTQLWKNIRIWWVKSLYSNKIISTLINLSFNEGISPGSLKLATVMPILKRGDQYDYNNYRPVSALSNITKLMEKLLYDWLYKSLN